MGTRRGHGRPHIFQLEVGSGAARRTWSSPPCSRRTGDLGRARWPLLRACTHRDRGRRQRALGRDLVAGGCVAAPCANRAWWRWSPATTSSRLAAVAGAPAMCSKLVRCRGRQSRGRAAGCSWHRRGGAGRHLFRARPGGELVRHQRPVGGSRVHHAGEHRVAAAAAFRRRPRALRSGRRPRCRHPRHLQRRGSRPLRDRRRRRLLVPHLARASRSRRLRLRARARRQPEPTAATRSALRSPPGR